MYTIDVLSTVLESSTEELESPIPSLSHSEHVVYTSLKGHPQLAADHLLNTEMRGKLAEVLGDIIRRLSLEFSKSKPSSGEIAEKQAKKVMVRQRAYETLTEISLNLIGMEHHRVGFSDMEVDESLKHIIHALDTWETMEKDEGAEVSVAKAVVERFLLDMGKIMHGEGMVAKIGEEIHTGLVDGRWTSSFIEASKDVIQSNIYYKMIRQGLCKFGNDYALGLRWLRHLGFVQVSTNPVLAAIAYEDDPELWDEFRKVAENHKEWMAKPEEFGDEIAMQATMVALWPNLAIFRPIALLSELHDGMVSYQLNPNVAATFEDSIEDALRIYSAAEEFLRRYDAYLTWGFSNTHEKGRPNMVFKVAGGYPAAVEITASLNSLGIGTNNTVTYTVAQEVTLIMAAMRGMAEAVKRGIRPTQVYETNMGGRLESHLRDLEAEKLLLEALSKAEDEKEILRGLAEELYAEEELKREVPLEEKIRGVCSYTYLKRLNQPAFVEIITSAKTRGKTKEETLDFLSGLESDLGLAGTFIAQRVYWIFFSPENRPKWLLHLQREFGLSPSEAEEVMDKIDVLPASKRKPSDTFLTLAESNMTNTEFPNHQWDVLQTSWQEGFNAEEYNNAILRKPELGVLERLLTLADFRKAYELTLELQMDLEKIGTKGDFGGGGLRVKEWPSFGSVVKTMNQFSLGYEEFKKRAVDFVRKMPES
ncbi:MAG: hypothetical protein OEY31_04815 [Candidatus Bathyarchaeota archaeon]|nr:hypothetical protein [Candidatus Bathyarchaeota archaeon]